MSNNLHTLPGRLEWHRSTGFTVDGHPIDPITAMSVAAVDEIRRTVARLRTEVAEWEPGR